MNRAGWLKIALVAILVSLIAWFYTSGLYQELDPERARAFIREAGLGGAALFVLAYACLQPLGINGLVFLLSAPLIWSPIEAFALNWIGTVGTGVFSFSFARFVARDWVQKRLPARVRRFDDRLHTRGFMTVLLLRLVFYTTPTVQYALGVSRVRVLPFLAGTILGVAPFTWLTTFLGVRINAWLDQHPVSTWPWDQIGPLLVVSAIVLTALGVFGFRKWRARTVD
ncbi:MAG: VTT domain-containing protein [Myxococcota bacterium]